MVIIKTEKTARPAKKAKKPAAGKAKRGHKIAKRPAGEPAMTTNAIRRISNRAGAKRITKSALEATRRAANDFAERLMRTATVYTNTMHRTTIMCKDVLWALDDMGRPMMI